MIFGQSILLKLIENLVWFFSHLGVFQFIFKVLIRIDSETPPKLTLVMDEDESSDTPENERTIELARDFKIDSETQPTQIID